MERIDRISWLDKLIELLTEHCRRYYWFKETDDIKIDNDSCNFYLYLKWTKCFPIQPERLIFKHFLFIKYLVENNRIDIERLHKIVDYILVIKENYVNAHKYNSDCLLMLLSISNTPIEDLISYLK